MSGIGRRLSIVGVLLAAAAVGSRGTLAAQTDVPAGEPAPAWYAEEVAYLTRDGGHWRTDNAAYLSDAEPYVEYGLVWSLAAGGTVARGRLFGIDAAGDEHHFWDLELYWDALAGSAVVIQFDGSGGFGRGELVAPGPDERELIQDFTVADGGFTMRHVETRSPDEKRASTFIRAGDEWRPNRTYVWRRVPPPAPAAS